MPVKEPAARKKKGAVGRCATAAKGVAHAALDNRVGRLANQVFMTVANYAESIGPAGEELARSIRIVSTQARSLTGKLSVPLDRTRRLPKKAQMEAMKAGWKGEPDAYENLSPKAKEAWDHMQPALDQGVMQNASTVGFRRQQLDGSRTELKGSGRWYPTIYTDKGQRALAAALKNRDAKDSQKAAIYVVANNHPAIKKSLKGMSDEELNQVNTVALGHEDADKMSEEVIAAGRAIAANVDWGFSELNKLREMQHRGIVPYLERVRLEVPEEWMDFNPQSALPGFFEKMGMQIAGAREWGADGSGLSPLIGRISDENGGAIAGLFDRYIKVQLGNSDAGAPPDFNALSQVVRDLTMLRLFGAAVIGPIRNAGQPFTNGTDQPIGAWIKSMKDLPPFMHSWIESSKELRELIIESGAITTANPVTETTRGSRLGKVARNAAVIHIGVIRGNEFRSAAIAYAGMQMNLARLLKWEAAAAAKESGELGPISQLLLDIRHLSIDPQTSNQRALERSGLSMERQEELMQAARDATPEQLQAMLEKPFNELRRDEILTALQIASIDTQFGYALANRAVYTGQSAAFGMWNTVRGWGFRQVGWGMKYVFRELGKNNAKPLVKALAAMALLGEVWQNFQDAKAGTEQSIYNRIKSEKEDNGDEILAQIVTDMGNGGSFAFLMDVMFGWTNVVGGPIFSSVLNTVRAGSHITQMPAQTGTAILDLADRELIATNQAKGLYYGAKQLLEGEEQRFFLYGKWRARAYEFLDAEDVESWGDNVQAGVTGFLQGNRAQDPTPRSLTYEQAAKAITHEDQARAVSNFSRLFRQAGDAEERVSMFRGMQTAGRQRSPLGIVSTSLRDFLDPFPAGDAVEASELQSAWLGDWNRAVSTALANTEGQYKNGGN